MCVNAFGACLGKRLLDSVTLLGNINASAVDLRDGRHGTSVVARVRGDKKMPCYERVWSLEPHHTQLVFPAWRGTVDGAGKQGDRQSLDKKMSPREFSGIRKCPGCDVDPGRTRGPRSRCSAGRSCWHRQSRGARAALCQARLCT